MVPSGAAMSSVFRASPPEQPQQWRGQAVANLSLWVIFFLFVSFIVKFVSGEKSSVVLCVIVENEINQT